MTSIYTKAEKLDASFLTSEDKKTIFANLGTGQVSSGGPRGYFAVGHDGKHLSVGKSAIQNGTVYFKNCNNSQYNINSRSTRIFIENCKKCTFTVNESIITSTIEVWRCKDITLKMNKRVETIQADLNKKISIQFNELENFGSIVWAGCNNMKVSFDDMSRIIKTGVIKLRKTGKEEYKDIDESTDQFILRMINGALYHEKIIRVGSGYVTTERENNEHEERERKNLEAGKRFLAERLPDLNSIEIEE